MDFVGRIVKKVWKQSEGIQRQNLNSSINFILQNFIHIWKSKTLNMKKYFIKYKKNLWKGKMTSLFMLLNGRLFPMKSSRKRLTTCLEKKAYLLVIAWALSKGFCTSFSHNLVCGTHFQLSHNRSKHFRCSILISFWLYII